MSFVKIEPGVVNAVREHIKNNEEILPSDLINNLKEFDNYVFDQKQVAEIIKNHLADFVEFRKDVENRIVFAWKDELQMKASKHNLNQLEITAFKHIRDAAESGMKSTARIDKK